MGCYVAEGLEHKAAQVHTGVGQGEVGGVDYKGVVEDEVDVDGSRGVGVACGCGVAVPPKE